MLRQHHRFQSPPPLQGQSAQRHGIIPPWMRLRGCPPRGRATPIGLNWPHASMPNLCSAATPYSTQPLRTADDKCRRHFAELRASAARSEALASEHGTDRSAQRTRKRTADADPIATSKGQRSRLHGASTHRRRASHEQQDDDDIGDGLGLQARCTDAPGFNACLHDALDSQNTAAALAMLPGHDAVQSYSLDATATSWKYSTHGTCKTCSSQCR
jgi:hypothetical protein